MQEFDTMIKSIIAELQRSESQVRDLEKTIGLLRDMGENVTQRQIEYQQLVAKREHMKKVLREKGYAI